MQLTDHPRKNSDNKLLAFRSPTPRGAFGALTAGLHLNDVPHDIATLRRPVDVETLPLPQLDEPEELARDARNLLTSIELFASLLAEPGVLAEEHQHFASDLKSLTIPLAGLAERMARASGSGSRNLILILIQIGVQNRSSGGNRCASRLVPVIGYGRPPRMASGPSTRAMRA